MYRIFFVHSSVNGHFGHFHVLAIVNSAAMFLNYNLIWIYSQKWYCWIIQWFCFLFSFVAQLLSYLWLFRTSDISHSPMNFSIPGFPVLHYLPEFAQIHVHWVSDAIQPFHLLLPSSPLPSIFPSIRVFSNEPALCIRGPMYWRFSSSISLSSEYSGLTSFRIDCFHLLAVHRTVKSLLQHHNWKV